MTIHNLLFNLTKLGDAALLLPLTTLLFVIYWRYQSRSAALWLVGAVGSCAVLTILLKVTFMTCAGVWHTGITSPSGHTSMGTVVYGAAGLLAIRHTSTPQRWVLLALTATLIAVIAISRIATGAHNFGEVLVGLAVGATACVAFAVHYLRRPHARAERSGHARCIGSANRRLRWPAREPGAYAETCLQLLLTLATCLHVSGLVTHLHLRVLVILDAV